MKLKIELTGGALQLFDDFVKYAHTNTAEVADAMYYCHDGFVERLRALDNAIDEGVEQ